ncbi:hypothetical protein LOTGIDRAFT_225148 [Lottia gigantea]|uniref:Ubiquitin carboxyl-terminal hydrolase MINDY n=1 Tax=Lottia gigantea TaxID=225164 RepID=V4B6Q9_LOTGI|nr:hypothetical protein LOTGIDRAFT_225148 [Lottia gigantea]ESP01777.1 hypothetical protein LOTGIDRAFT_225148 [Lottia gigantea]
MAAFSESEPIDSDTLQRLTKMLWGNNVKEDVFDRWSQGFIFSEDEPTALAQLEGGPCAIIVPVQAYILKNIFFSDHPKVELSNLSKEECCNYLYKALVEILLSVNSSTYYIVTLSEPHSNQDGGSNTTCQGNSENRETGERDFKRRKIDRETFHTRLRFLRCESENEMKRAVTSLLPVFQQKYGLLLYMYSILLSRGIDQIRNEVGDNDEPLIDGVHGHGSQSLINLLITGRALSNVFDNEKDVCGLILRGIQQQSVVGFLTLLEHMRYCEVGWYLKNPCVPIWVLGSETHLTVLFAKDRGLVENNSPIKNAQQIFATFDPEGNGFIQTSQLGDVMEALNLFCDKEYVDIMKGKLDGESLGIITSSSFLGEFYAEELNNASTPQKFEIQHYNGLARSCHNKKIKYVKGTAELPNEIELQIVTDTSPIKLCLQTKWPSIELRWQGDFIPSLN